MGGWMGGLGGSKTPQIPGGQLDMGASRAPLGC